MYPETLAAQQAPDRRGRTPLTAGLSRWVTENESRSTMRQAFKEAGPLRQKPEVNTALSAVSRAPLAVWQASGKFLRSAMGFAVFLTAWEAPCLSRLDQRRAASVPDYAVLRLPAISCAAERFSDTSAPASSGCWSALPWRLPSFDRVVGAQIPLYLPPGHIAMAAIREK